MPETTTYGAKVNSPTTTLSVGCTNSDTTLTFVDATVFPDAPNIATLGTGDNAETVQYTGKTATTLTGCTRGFQGTAQAWTAGTVAGRFFTAHDHDTFKRIADRARYYGMFM